MCSDDIGFHGAWYVATLVDIVDASPTKKRASNKKNRDKKRVGYLVKYATLFEDDKLDKPLTEVVHPSYIRPLPPRNPRSNNDIQAVAEAETEEGSADFQVNDVVDAYLRDGWWIGVVRKVIGDGDGDGEMKKYLVSFESPPEEFEFDGSQLRLHVDWVDSLWKLRPQKTPNQESSDKNATLTSNSNNESNNGAHSDIITPPSKRASMTGSRRLSAKKKTHSRKKAVTNAETIGAGKRSVTYRRSRRVVNLEEGENLHENLQSSTPVENSGSKGNTEEIVSVMETTQAKHQDSLILEQETTIEETYETQNGNSQLKRKRRRPSKSQSQEPNGSLEDNQERDSSGINEITTGLEEQPLSVWYQGLHPLPVFKKNPCYNSHEPIVAPNSTVVNESQPTENHHVWPFVKRSPIWATIESQEVYQNLSQNPHFSPLWEIKEERREGLAIAHMVTFANLVQRITSFQWADPSHAIKSSLETLVELEANGFDVGPVRARLDELLAQKSEAGRLEGEMKEAEKEADKCNSEKMAIDEEIKGFERKMREMEEKMVRAVAMKYVKDEEMVVVRSRLQGVSKRIGEWKVAFEELVRSPL